MPELDFQSLQRRIEAVVHARAQVRLVYLFGSRVSGEIGPLSDTDLGVLLEREAPVARMRAQLAHLFSAALDGSPVDVIILNRAPIELAYAVIAQGKIL